MEDRNDVMDVDVVKRPAKRFKHQSHKQTLKKVHVTSALAREQLNLDIGDHESHFHEALDQWRELNLAPKFLEFANKADGLSASMALLLHHWQEIVQLWLEAMNVTDEEGLKPLLDLLQKLAYDLRTTITPLYASIQERILKLLLRTLAAETVKTVLDTFSVVFKYVAIPSEIIEESWATFAEVLPKSDPEVQRAVAELWGTTVRRLKAQMREKCVLSIVSSASPDVSSWVFVTACKSVSQTLHTTTSSIFTPLLRYYLSCDDPEDAFTVLRRLLTALAHHVKTADQFSPISDLLSEELTNFAKEESDGLRRLLEIIAVPCSVRQGSRVSAKHLATLLSHFEFLPLTDHLHDSLLKFTVACLTAGDMALWMGPGRKVITRAWQRPILALELCCVLSDLNWGGWKLLAMPQVVKSVPDLLDTHTEKALELLSSLQALKKLQVDASWKQRLQTWFSQRLAPWNGSPEQVLILHHAISLSDLLPGLSPLLVSVVNATHDAENPILDYAEHETNSSWIIGSCLSCLARRNPTEWRNQVDITAWTTRVVQKWAWSGYALGGLVSIINVTQTSGKLPFDSLYENLRTSLLSHSRRLRLSVLRLLNSAVINGDVPTEVLKKCLQAEEVTIDVQGVRERVMRISRLNHILKDNDQVGAEISVMWLIAQLKVNLRPLWSPAADALAAVSDRFGDVAWNLLFEQVKAATAGQFAEESPDWMIMEDTNYDSISEVERSWRDPSAHKLRSSVEKRLRGTATRQAIIHAQLVEERFDQGGYEIQLLNALGACSSLAERHSRDLIPHFLSLAPPEAPTKLARHRLSAWLTLFSKFVNPKALRSTEELRRIYTVLISHPDRQLQKLAVACVLTYKSPSLIAHEDSLFALLDDTRWRDQLTQLDIAGIKPAERSEFVDTIIRVLYGVMLERRGRSRGADRRAAVLSSLGGCTSEDLHTLVDLMLQPINKDHEVNLHGEYQVRSLAEGVSDKQLVGFLTLLADVVKNLGTRLLDQWPILLTTLLDVVAHAQKRITSTPEVLQEQEEEDDDDDKEEDASEGRSGSRAIRTVRQAGIKRFAEFFRLPVTFDFRPYLKEAFKTFISPRLEALDAENTQAPSALLELFHTWSTQEGSARFLVEYDERTLPKIYACLVATNVKPSVVSKVLDIIEYLIGFSQLDEDFLNAVFKPHVELLLTNFATLMERTKGTISMSDHIGRRQVTILSALAPYMADSRQAVLLLNLFTPVLRKPSKSVPEKVKVDMVNIMKSLLPLVSDLSDSSSAVYMKTYSLLSFLFQSLRSRPARIALVACFRKLTEIDSSLSSLANILADLNAYSTKRMEEPDFETRIEAFVLLNEKKHSSLTAQEWLPILYNMLNFIQDAEELSVRSNASHSMKRFIDCVQGHGGEFETTFTKTLYPGLKNGLRSKNELVRAEILGVISYAVKTCERLTGLQEMRVLQANGDEEANIFNNILHVQLHRRTRALRRLAEFSSEGALRSSTLAEIFVPLVGNYIIDGTSTDHHLVTEAINTTGKIAGQLQWGAYYSLVQQYLRLSRSKDASERIYVRTLVALLDNFHFSMETIVSNEEVEEPAIAESEDAVEEVEVEPTGDQKKQAHIAEVVNSRLLPNLIQHLEKRDETEDSLRIPIAIGIVQVALHLPQNVREAQVTRLLTSLSQVFRSKSQDTRDLARETLCKVIVILGPSYLPLTLRELRGALLRGPHLHILAFVTHALLVHVTSGENAETFARLDDCVNDVAHVSAEVIFGESGKDVQSEDFKTKMREVRSSASRGMDSFAIIAKHITPPKISSLLVPIRNILQQTETLKVMQQVEDLLRRIAGGLNANQHLTPKDLLVLCHTLISQNAKFLKQAPKHAQANEKTKGDAITEMKKHLTVEADHYANNSFRFVAFGLDLFNTAFRRSRFDFQDPAVIARLEPMVTVIGNTLYSTHMQVVTSGLKAAASILRCPLNSIAKSLPVFIRQTLQIVKQTGSTEAEVVQTAFKSLATILRDQPSAQIKENDLVFLLELLSPDLEEPTRQASVFTMLKAIVARKFVVPEIYDLMERVSEIMVTNQSPSVQEQCRAILLQFLLDYPQGKGRLRNQMTFLAKNLSYVHESGRKSVMELLSAILSKFSPTLIHEYSDLLFVALVLVIANDESTKCREMASELVKNLFSRLEEPQRRTVVTHVHSWASQRAQPQLARVSSQIYGILIDHLQNEVAPYANAILGDLNAILDSTCKLLEEEEAEDDATMDIDIEWQIPYQALNALAKLLRTCPELTTQDDKVSWANVVALLLFPHAWVRTAACRLLGTLFSAVPAAAPSEDLDEESPFSLAGMEDIAKKLCLQLRSEHLDGPLSLQIVKNLFYIGKCFSMVQVVSSVEEDQEDEDEDEDEDEGGEEDQAQEQEGDSRPKNPLAWLFSKLSYQARSAHITRRNKSRSAENWSHQPMSVFRWFAAMVSFLDAPQVEKFLTHILSPIYRIAEDDTIRDPQMDELKTVAIELQELVQAKAGTTKFAEVYSRIRQNVIGVRRERRTARVVQAASNPALASKRKIHRNVAKKESRKRKSTSFAESRGKFKRRRDD